MDNSHLANEMRYDFIKITHIMKREQIVADNRVLVSIVRVINGHASA
jgi:hypothetical protein